MSDLALGLRLSFMGILITFVSLGILILVMVVLREGFKPPNRGVKAEAKEPVEQSNHEPVQEDIYARAAGLAVAIALLKSKQHSGGLGQLLEAPPNRWWSIGTPRER